jgi:hypothetical protein
LTHPDRFAYYQNGQFNIIPLPNQFEACCVGGPDINNIYVGGDDYVTNRKKLFKWKNYQLEDMFFPDTTSSGFGIRNWIGWIYGKSQNEIWIGETRGIVWRYDGNNFTSYILDTTYASNISVRIALKLLIDINNNFCCYLMRDSTNPEQTTGSLLTKFYKYEGNSFQLTYTNYITYPSIYAYYPQNLGKDIFSIINDGIYHFNEYSFNKVLGLGIISEPRPYLTGLNLNELIIIGSRPPDHYPIYCFNWNGKNWSKEIDLAALSIIGLNYTKSQYVIMGTNRLTTEIFVLRK